MIESIASGLFLMQEIGRQVDSSAWKKLHTR